MTPEMAFECLFVSRDVTLYTTIHRVLRNLSIAVEHCLRCSDAHQAIAKGTHDLVVFNWDGDASSDLMRAIWSLPKKKKPTIMVISDEGAIPGAHVILRKPVTLESSTDALKTAYARMLLDHRLHARRAVMVEGTAEDQNGYTFPITVTDLSDGGVGITSRISVVVGSSLLLKVPLREAPMPLDLHVRVVWTRRYGAAGCEIVNMPPVHRSIFQDWLKSKIRVKKPLISV